MELITIFYWLCILLAVVTVVGHLIWLAIEHVVKLFISKDDSPPLFPPDRHPVTNTGPMDLFKDLAATERQLEVFYHRKEIDGPLFQFLKEKVNAEYERLRPTPPPVAKPTPAPTPVTPVVEPSTPRVVNEEPELVPVVSFKPDIDIEVVEPVAAVQPRPRRRSFSEVLNSFMEESNIRWGEIIGGLLIIGCSTALVVSLWAQISEIPVLKFLIFTTVTAVLFGIGLYTEHRWKLPTTSRGILTIATLLVPLNFLAIAAVSLSGTASALVIASELVAPAIFLCLVYFAGRVITPRCAHVLSAGVLSSSVGQLLVRHFALDAEPALMVLLGAFPVCCYVIAIGLGLRIVLADREITEDETTSVFTMLGIMSFASVLPFGLLLYRAGPLSSSMMYLAPVVTLWGVPMLAVGSALWSRIKDPALVGSRVAGSAFAILGVAVVLLGMILAWPNPSSIVPAALLNFAVFTTLAVLFNLPFAHGLAAGCFALVYLVVFHVAAGNISWQNLRVTSLVETCLTVSSGQALVGVFALFVVVSEWLVRRGRAIEGRVYRYSAWTIAVLSLTFATLFGWWNAEYQHLWLIYGFFAVSAYAFVARLRQEFLGWIGSFLALIAFADLFSRELLFLFPWQTSLLVLATVLAIAAIAVSRTQRLLVLTRSLNYASIVSVVLAVVSLFQTNPWQITSMQAERLFWISGILGLSLWLNRRKLLLNAFQLGLTIAAVLTVKAVLQQYDWYAYLAHAFLHPVALEIQGTVLALLCLSWIAARKLVQRVGSESFDILLGGKHSVDRIVLWGLVPAFLLLTCYGSLSGITQELAAKGSDYAGFNVAGFSHTDAVGLGAWVLLGLLVVAMLATYAQRRHAAYLYGAIAAAAGVVPLLAARFESQIAVATAMRWFAAGFLLLGSIAIWLRSKLVLKLAPAMQSDEGSFHSGARVLLISLTVVPLSLLTLYPTARALSYLPVQSPVSGFFSLPGDALSYGIPLLITAAVFVGYAIRERLPEYGFYAGLFLNATVTLAYLLSVVAANGVMDRVVLVQVIQLNGIAFAGYILPWMAMRHIWSKAIGDEQQRDAQRLLTITLILTVLSNVVLIVCAASVVMFDGAGPGTATFATGGPLSWLNFVLTSVAAGWWSSDRQKKFSGGVLVAWLSLLACLVSFVFLDESGLLAGRVLTFALALTAMVSNLIPTLRNQTNAGTWISKVFDLEKLATRTRLWSALLGGLAAILSLRFLRVVDYNEWSIGTLLLLSAFYTLLNWQALKRRYLYLAGITFHLAISIWWLIQNGHGPRITDLFHTNLIAGSVVGIGFMWMELRARQLRAKPSNNALSYHNVGGLFAIVLLTFIVVLRFDFAFGEFMEMTPVMPLLSLAAITLFFVACLWDRSAKHSVACLYWLGLVAGAHALQQFELPHTRFAWTWSIYLAVFTILSTLLWRRRIWLLAIARQLHIPRRLRGTPSVLPWLAAATALSVGTVFCIAYWIVLRFVAFDLRLTAALAFTSSAVALALLANGSWRTRWQRGAVGVFVSGVVLVAWSFLTPGVNGTWLNRSVILMVTTFSLTGIYAVWLNRMRLFSASWSNAVKSSVPSILGAGLIALLFGMSTEIFYQISFGAVRIHTLSLVALGLTLVASVLIGLLFALSPQHDPLALSDRDRTVYVYAAEVMLALLFLHVRLTMPWLFTGMIERYWPMIVVAIAYFGVVASEALRRRELFVLAKPLERTGAFLPMLPVLGFWIATSEVDFSLLLFVIGGLYGLLAVLRRSFVFGVLAAVAGNGALWYMLHRTADYQLFQHPQLWLIPIALSVLLAAYLNEERLTEDQMTSVRYLSLVTVYASSTADIFINGVATSPWLPLVLASLSLAGVFAGILFRIRGMLLLGSMFLLLSIVTMIWYGSENFGWTWLWYVAGIATGATIIFMFAVFEKKRSEVLRLVDGLREWER
jgi:hypothetical protein